MRRMGGDTFLDEFMHANERRRTAARHAMALQLDVTVAHLADLAFLAFGCDYAQERCRRAWKLTDEWWALLEENASGGDLDAIADAATAQVTDVMHAELLDVREVLAS